MDSERHDGSVTPHRTTSVEFTEAHFDAKALRYRRALAAAPHARTLETLPFFLLVGSQLGQRVGQARMADVLCGSGFLTRAFHGSVAEILGVDVSAVMLADYPSGPGLMQRRVGVDDHLDLRRVLGQRDAIVSLAGLHHVYVLNGGTPEPQASALFQHSVVRGWAACLAAGGIMVVADVTDPDEVVAKNTDVLPLRGPDRALAQRYRLRCAEADFVLGSGSGLPLDPPDSVADYVSAVVAATGCRSNCSPGRWFREIVAKRGLYGHQDQFLRPTELVRALQGEGRHAAYHEIPTPWLFRSEDDFIYFFYEKFALGPPRECAELTTETKDFIVSKATEHLGVQRLPRGGVTVGWRLGFYVVT